MIAAITNTLLHGWSLRRWLGLGMGTFFVIEAILERDSLMGVFGLFFLFQSLTNTGCFSSKGCVVPVQDTHSYTNNSSVNDTSFTEIK